MVSKYEMSTFTNDQAVSEVLLLAGVLGGWGGGGEGEGGGREAEGGSLIGDGHPRCFGRELLGVHSIPHLHATARMILH